MRPDEFADAAEEAPVEALSADEQADAGAPDMVLLDSADDLPAYRPEQAEAPASPPPGEPVDDDAGLTFTDSANPTARFRDEAGAAPPAAPPQRKPSGPQPRRRPPSGRGRRPSGANPRRPATGRLRKGPPSRRSTPSRGSGVGDVRRRSTPSGSERSSESARRPRLGNTRSRKRASEHSASATSAAERLRARKERPERDASDAQAALARLEALVHPAPANDPFVGRDLGPFKVQDFISTVRGERRYLALHEETKSPCLLRVFPFVGAYADEFKRVADRGERAARVEHPHLDLTLGVGRVKECFYVGTRPPWGPTLAEKLAKGPLERSEVLEIVEQLGRALKGLHAREMFHGHLSPEVIREEEPGYYVLHEAGVARARAAYSFLSAGGDVLGAPGYIAPETVDSGGASRAADIYALGCLAWSLLAGRLPFSGSDEVQTLLDQLNQEVPRLDAVGVDVEPNLATFVAKATGYTADVRYSDTNELLNDLRALNQGESVKAFGDEAKPDAEPEAERVGRGDALLIGLLLLNFALVGYVALVWWQAGQLQLDDPLVGYELPVNATGE